MTAARTTEASSAHITTTLPLPRLVPLCEQAAAALSIRTGQRRGIRVRLERVGAYRLDYAVSAGRGVPGHVSVCFTEENGQTVLWLEGSFAAPMHQELAARVRAADASAEGTADRAQQTALARADVRPGADRDAAGRAAARPAAIGWPRPGAKPGPGTIRNSPWPPSGLPRNRRTSDSSPIEPPRAARLNHFGARILRPFWPVSGLISGSQNDQRANWPYRPGREWCQSRCRCSANVTAPPYR